MVRLLLLFSYLCQNVSPRNTNPPPYTALISVLVERIRRPDDLNGTITSYLKYQLFNFLLCVPKSLVARLPPEDLLFIELIQKVMLPSARIKVCIEWGRIRRGEATVDEARTRIPRKDLAFAAFKAEYQVRKNKVEAPGKETKGV
jgi:hypothetical protein